ncbi:MAG: hypothetical protein AB7V42_00240 [Thermoleophilia bacterium]
MTHPPVYDALDTIRWMLDEARRELAAETVIGADGRARRKTKARRHDDRVRFETLCTVVWNIGGRNGPLEALTDEAIAA